MKTLISASALILLGLAACPSAMASVIYDDGATLGTSSALFIDGPGAGPFHQTISDAFIATGGGTLGELDVGLWVPTGATPTTLTWWLGTSFLDNSIGGGTVALSAANSTFLFNNGLGYDIFNVKITGLSSATINAGSNYVLTLGNGNDSLGDQFVAWDMISGPATCTFAVSGTNDGSCNYGGEAFTLLTGSSVTTVPEPSALALFGAGLLGLFGFAKKRTKV